MMDPMAGRPRGGGFRGQVQPPLRLRMGRILLRRKKVSQQDFSSVWQLLGLVEDDDWATSAEEAASTSFVFLYAVDVTDVGLEGQVPRNAPIRVLAVRPPVSQCPSLVEHQRIASNLRDYLRSQLASSPLTRHFIFVFNEKHTWIGLRSKSTSILGGVL
ncbi:hypothetical protein cyc_03060 [Cyclospora cayetanensis]|uniref:Uncharacterized protein n=1 Tax=Cyclospora cayetanensis TaxID=88456 RepID=A0A1D3CWV6_9EIME|nr:hypothetical protein cyc_03060 [Cyclospora cayetanensis]